jgi:hypothetical protein
MQSTEMGDSGAREYLIRKLGGQHDRHGGVVVCRPDRRSDNGGAQGYGRDDLGRPDGQGAAAREGKRAKMRFRRSFYSSQFRRCFTEAATPNIP